MQALLVLATLSLSLFITIRIAAYVAHLDDILASCATYVALLLQFACTKEASFAVSIGLALYKYHRMCIRYNQYE